MVKTNPFVTVSRLAKQADVAADAAQRLEDMAASEGRSKILNIGLAALGAGVAARGVTGLFNLSRRRLNPPKPKYPHALVTEVPIPVEEEEAVSPPTFKRAGYYTEPSSFPWFFPGALAATGVGAIAGWKGMDALLDSRRKAEQEQEMNDSKNDFESALLESYARPRKVLKTAGEELGEVLDTLFDKVAADVPPDGIEKTASTWADTFGKLTGLYGAYALGTGGIAAALAYNRGAKHSDRAVLDKAMSLRMRRAFLARPSEVLAVPRAVTVRPRHVDEDPAIEAAVNETPNAATAPKVDVRPEDVETIRKRRRIG